MSLFQTKHVTDQLGLKLAWKFGYRAFTGGNLKKKDFKILREKVRKHAFGRKKEDSRKKEKKTRFWPRKQERKHDLDQENK